MVLVGEEARNLQSGHPAKFYGLCESAHPTDEGMLSKCAELSLMVDAWYSNVIEQAHHALLREFNRRQEQKHLDAVQLLNAPLLSEAGDAEQLFYYADSEFNNKTLNQKLVFLTECPKIRAALLNVPPAWTPDDILRLPEVTALYYVLGAMFLLPYSAASRRPAQLHY